MIITAFDPVKGRGPELARFELGQHANSGASAGDHLLLCDISPDGTRLAIARSADGPLEIHSLHGQPTHTIPNSEIGKISLIKWAADSKGLFVSKGNEIVHVDLKGGTYGLWKSTGPVAFGRPSPDGRHIAIFDSQQSQNMWMMENF